MSKASHKSNLRVKAERDERSRNNVPTFFYEITSISVVGIHHRPETWYMVGCVIRVIRVDIKSKSCGNLLHPLDIYSVVKRDRSLISRDCLRDFPR
jgi:hypothetical protein